MHIHFLCFAVLGDVCMSGSTDCDTAVPDSQCAEVSRDTFKCLCKAGYYGEAGTSQCERSMYVMIMCLLNALQSESIL